MDFKKISAKTIIIWEILAAIATLLLLFIVIRIMISGTWLWYLILWIIGASYTLIAFLYIPFYYLSIEYCITKDKVIYRKGVFFFNTQILYRDRIAFVTVYNNPLTPILKLSSLTLSAAGGRIHIWFLDSNRAHELANMLKES